MENFKAIIEFTYKLWGSEDGFSICKYKATYDVTLSDNSTIQKTDVITVKGEALPQRKGISYNAVLKPIDDKKYGRQYELLSSEPVPKKGREGTISFLTGIVKGIGKKKASDIYDKFGEDSVRIFKEEPYRLIRIKGISKKSVDKWVESYKEHTIAQDVFEELAPAEIPIATCVRIANILGINAVTRIKENPYCISAINGVGFPTADRVGKMFGFADNCEERIYAASVSVISRFISTGCVGMPAGEFSNRLAKTVCLNQTVAWNAAVGIIKKGRLAYRRINYEGKERFYIYLPMVKAAEEELAKRIIEVEKSAESMTDLAQKAIAMFPGETQLDPSQNDAVIKAFSAGVSVITGGPGTGKTTIIKRICEIGEKIGYKNKIMLMAPTGKAARRMSECTGRPASTIHSALKIRPNEAESDYIGEEETGTEEIEDCLIIVDEFSMVDMWISKALFDTTKNCRFILVGDSDQLPSVSCGNVLHDMIESGVIPYTTLKYCHRQAEGSTIAYNANLIREGVGNLIESKDFEIRALDPHNTKDYNECLTEVEDLMTQCTLDCRAKGEDVICLAPFHKNPAGVIATNMRIQESVNPTKGELEYTFADGRCFRVGDEVMHIKKNHADVSVLNGDTGVIKRIFKDDDGETSIEVEYDGADEPYYYTRHNIEELTLAYTLTVHKSQGSEYGTVIVCLTRYHGVMLKRNILYTAITRAKKRVIVITSDVQSLDVAVRNNQAEDRYTLLTKYLRDAYFATDTANMSGEKLKSMIDATVVKYA